MKQPVFEGVATALVTPFKNGTIDDAMFETLLDRQLAAGIDAIVVCGTTGEASTLSMAEQLGLISHAIQYVRGRCKIIAGTGCNDTAHCLQLSRVAASMGADALLLVTPYYNKCTQEGLIRHYLTVADAVPCPVIAYNVPSRTGVDIAVDTLVRLSKHPNVNGVKEAGGSTAKAARTIERCGDDLFLWSGNDDQTASLMALGAKGVISVASNVVPKKMLELTRACQSGQYDEAGRMQCALMPLLDALFCEVNPIPVKAAMRLVGFDVGSPRLPLTELTEKNVEALKTILEHT